MTAYIGYDNAFEQSGVTITADFTPPTGYELANCYDYKTHTAIKSDATGGKRIKLDAGSGNTITANYIGVVAHTLGTTANGVQLRYSDDDITYTAHLSKTSITVDDLIFVKGDSETHRYWEVLLDSTTTSTTVGHVMFGTALQCRPIGAGFRPPVYEHYESINAQGNAANYLGRSIKRVPQDLRIRQQGIDPADFRTDWVPFLEHAAQKPFFFCWDYENYSDEAVYCWTEKPQQPSYAQLCHMAIDLSVKAIKA
ncbi:MAG: hypothetical protein EX270_11285 [Pseudomonadales bacterium]|nr:MAG: hypothetical protein EX270_11285 [Pseudomonadales bacterium]